MINYKQLIFFLFAANINHYCIFFLNQVHAGLLGFLKITFIKEIQMHVY